MKKFFRYKNNNPIEVSGWPEVQIFCADKHSIQAFQVVAVPTNADKIVVDATAETVMEVQLTTKLGETFAAVGYINWNPNN